MAPIRPVVLVFLLSACGPTAGSGGAGDGVDGGGESCQPGTTEACYDGPVGTQGVGICHAGTRTCYDNGFWSPCSDEVLPAAEICDNQIDEDCTGAADDVVDTDGDGWLRCNGDCCETLAECGEPARVNPGAAEAPTAADGVPVDDNCNGAIDETPVACDTGLALTDFDAVHGAWALGLCQTAATDGYGIIDASYTRASGAAAAASAQVGVFDAFGPNVAVREGTRMLALSSGHARRPADAGACNSFSCYGYGSGTAPSGFPQDSASCQGGSDINDDVALHLHLRAPSNAVGYSIDFAFYSFEYPEFVCTTWNDQFIIRANPAPADAVNGNIAFDSNGNPVSVNIAYFDVCDGCAQGTAALQGTGFDTWDDAGATTWLRTTAPVEAGQEFTLDFIIWDTGDQSWDSTVILDNFQWILEGSPGVETNPID